MSFSRIIITYGLLIGLFLAIAGCMTPERAMQETEGIGNRLAANYRRQATGNTNAFSIARPSDRLRVRLQAAAETPNQSATNFPPLTLPLVLGLSDALVAGARNSNDYQASKEDVFKAALALQLQQHAFENTFAGVLGGGVLRTETSGGDKENETTERATGSVKSTISRKLSNGATLSAALGLDVVRLLTGDRGSTLGLLGDATIKMPLLRGSGKLIATEALTQAERQLLYAIHQFEVFRQSYAVQVAAGYYDMIEVSQRVLTLKDNERRLTDNYRRAELLFEAGRMSQVELDQTRQDVLRTGDQLVLAEQSRQAQLDAFKIKLGLPVDAAIELDMRELERLQLSMGLDAALTNLVSLTAPELPFKPDEAIAIALTNRHDLILARYRLEDAERAQVIAADALRPELTLNGGFKFGQTKQSGRSTADTTAYSLVMDLDLPWERNTERNAYRVAAMMVDSARRTLETTEDTAKNSVRSGLRDIQSAWSSFAIQVEALRVALRRVRSTDLFQQAGRANTRDVLDAESALLSARNALVSAIVNYRMAGLGLRRDLSVLDISEEGLWRDENEPADNGR